MMEDAYFPNQAELSLLAFSGLDIEAVRARQAFSVTSWPSVCNAL